MNNRALILIGTKVELPVIGTIVGAGLFIILILLGEAMSMMLTSIAGDTTAG